MLDDVTVGPVIPAELELSQIIPADDRRRKPHSGLRNRTVQKDHKVALGDARRAKDTSFFYH